MTGSARQSSTAAAVLAALFVLVAVLAPALFPPDGDAGLFGAVVALVVLAWAGRGHPGTVRTVLTAATTPVREARRVAHRAGVLRQRDPDADGRPRPRAPGALRPEPATG
ncbi:MULTISPECIES: DUF6412 domain-containing protein [Pseudonocardia]|uniref:DUF6412 domain-containing protein n=1 Tax=Pseudonocardia TaxID=1847 RepID=UPI000F790076|nr:MULTISPECIES: DUF6412 domain-containing protein [Pseudonocardia]